MKIDWSILKQDWVESRSPSTVVVNEDRLVDSKTGLIHSGSPNTEVVEHRSKAP